jgi:hypothetical protein
MHGHDVPSQPPQPAHQVFQAVCQCLASPVHAFCFVICSQAALCAVHPGMCNPGHPLQQTRHGQCLCMLKKASCALSRHILKTLGNGG